MRRADGRLRLPFRIALWALLLGGSAATGAFVAAHTNPLPPQVDGGAVPSRTLSPHPSTVPKPKPGRWRGTMQSTSYHALYVGGTCETDWATTLAFTVAGDGSISGRARARLTSKDAPCPFAVAQIQIRSFALKVAGAIRGGNVHLQLTEVSHTPSAGAGDLGGFRRTVLSGEPVSILLVHLDDPGGTSATARVLLKAFGPDRDTFGSTNAIRLSCSRC